MFAKDDKCFDVFSYFVLELFSFPTKISKVVSLKVDTHAHVNCLNVEDGITTDIVISLFLSSFAFGIVLVMVY